ncbi:uncharacterized protein LOC141716766 [Apium graveolens]|uniref:uncharacterized protein LOC141716766 n=1 Tax=Apium graveolens TaxID=4045 RepID=UPI003D79A2B5
MSLPEEDEWELINDDGFVYKRNKRPRLDITATTSAPLPDPLVEDNIRKIRRRNTLLKLKDKYQAELSRWELLSNTLKDLNLQTQNVEKSLEKNDVGQGGDELSVEFSGFSRCALVDELLAQVEAQEAMINNIANFCDAAEALCNAQEERAKQAILDLPVWSSSPRELMNSLCDE